MPATSRLAPLRSALAVSLFVAIVVATVVLGFRYTQFLAPLELGAYDAYMRYRPMVDLDTSPVAVIEISEKKREIFFVLVQYPSIR